MGNGNIEIIVPLKWLSNVSRTLEMPVINFEISLNPTWSANCVICKADKLATFLITDTKLSVAVVTVPTQHNSKLREKVRDLGTLGTFNCNIYQLKHLHTQKTNNKVI